MDMKPKRNSFEMFKKKNNIIIIYDNNIGNILPYRKIIRYVLKMNRFEIHIDSMLDFCISKPIYYIVKKLEVKI